MVNVLPFIIVILTISVLRFLSGCRMVENRTTKNSNAESRTNGNKTAQPINHFLMRHPVMVESLLLFCIASVGCFIFPVGSQPFPLDPIRACPLICSYGIIGWRLAGFYGKAKGRAVYPLTLFMAILGMVYRYVLEYGEASSVYNFTMFNILSYITLMPALMVGAYHYTVEYLIPARQSSERSFVT